MSDYVSFKIGQFQINRDDHSIEFGENKKDSLQPKIIQVLVYLAEHYPRLISRKELIEKIWNGNAYVGDNALTNAIWHLRQVFNASNEPYIETVRKSGYRLLKQPEYPPETVQKKKTKDTLIYYIGFSLIVFVLLIGLLYYHKNKLSSLPTGPWISEFVTKNSGQELYPSLSNDGRFLLYSQTQFDETSDLFLLDLQSSSKPAVALTQTDELELRSVWGKNAENIYFVQQNQKNATCSIIKMNLHSKKSTKIAQCEFPNTIYLAISPDHSELMYHGIHSKTRQSGLMTLPLNEKGEPNGTARCFEQCRGDYRDIAYSNDGKFLTLTQRTGNLSENLILFDRFKNAPRQITKNFEDIFGLSWHSDNQRIIFSGEKRGLRQGYIFYIDSNIMTKLNVDGLSSPRFVPNQGEVIYYENRNTSHLTYLTFDHPQKTFSFPLIQSEFDHRNPDYSDKNKHLVFSSNQSGNFELWRSDLNGDNKTQLTHLGSSAFFPSWSPDGSKVVFLSPNTSGSGNTLSYYDLNKKQLTTINSPFEFHLRPTWSNNNEEIIVSAQIANDYQLFLMSINGESVTQITNNGAVYGRLFVNNTLYFTKGFNSGLWQKQLHSTKPERQVLSAQDFSTKYNWVPTKEGIVFLFHDKGIGKIQRYDSHALNIETLAYLPSVRVDKFGSFVYVEQEKRLIFTAKKDLNIDIKRLRHSSFE